MDVKFVVEFYETDDGKIPIKDFLESLDEKMWAKITGLMVVLQEKGTELRSPYTKHLDDGIFELRAKQGNNTTRALFFFYLEGRIVFTNGFIKKTQKTPPAQIELAKKYRADYINRYKNKINGK